MKKENLSSDVNLVDITVLEIGDYIKVVMENSFSETVFRGQDQQFPLKPKVGRDEFINKKVSEIALFNSWKRYAKSIIT